MRDELLKMVMEEIDGMSYGEALYYLDNDAIPATGSVTSLIYYCDTESFAKEYHDEIIELMNDWGMQEPLSLNDMAWVAWEATVLGQGEQILDELGWEPEEEDDGH